MRKAANLALGFLAAEKSKSSSLDKHLTAAAPQLQAKVSHSFIYLVSLLFDRK